jgi:hypothetical protein
MYESPNTVILQGDLITNEHSVDQRLGPTGQSNTDLWACMKSYWIRTIHLLETLSHVTQS